jgi:hypothetical protein
MIMEMPSHFIDFLANIRPTESQRHQLTDAHSALQELILVDGNLKPYIVTTFLQGSYRRHTALKACGGERCDVDIVVVTRFNRKMPPQEALDAFKPFLEKHYSGKFKAQGRSWAIDINDTIKLDLVPTAAPSESMRRLFATREIGSWIESGERLYAEKQESEIDPIVKAISLSRAKDTSWMLEPLDIPDREAKIWDKTHPLAQIEWASNKNLSTDGHYVNVVKALKWWRREREPRPKYPKSYPFEHLLGLNCPDDLKGVGHGVVSSLGNAIEKYAPDVSLGRVPYLHDHGFPPEERTHNVMRRVSAEDFADFYEKMKKAAVIARKALDNPSMHESSKLWRQLFGDEFPETPPDAEGGGGNDGKGGFSTRKGPSGVSTSRFG